MTQRNFALEGRVMGQAVRRQTLTAEAPVRSQATPCEIVVDTVTLGQVFVILLRFSPVIIIAPMPNTNLSLNTPSSEDKPTKRGDLQTKIQTLDKP